MTLTGYDIANVNGSSAYSRTAGDFVILKASEGTGFKDFLHDGWANLARAQGRLVGHYHYAHLTNSPTAEADWFVRCASAQAGEVMILDFEPYGQPVADASFPGWAVAFLQRVNGATGARCWIYLNDDMASRITRNATTAQLTVLTASPLWKARYRTSTPGSLFGWPGFAAWQWNDTPLDRDLFFGDATAWRNTGVGSATAAPAQPGLPGKAPSTSPDATGTVPAVAAKKEFGPMKILALEVDPNAPGPEGKALLTESFLTHIADPDEEAAVLRVMACNDNDTILQVEFDRVRAVFARGRAGA